MPEYMTLKDAALFCGCSVKTLRRRIASGQLVGYRSGRMIRVKRDELERHFQPMNQWAR